jgi:hypothetical protein
MALAVWLYFLLWHKVIHPIKYWKYRPKWVVVRQEGRPPMPMPMPTLARDDYDGSIHAQVDRARAADLGDVGLPGP